MSGEVSYSHMSPEAHVAKAVAACMERGLRPVVVIPAVGMEMGEFGRLLAAISEVYPDAVLPKGSAGEWIAIGVRP